MAEPLESALERCTAIAHEVKQQVWDQISKQTERYGAHHIDIIRCERSAFTALQMTMGRGLFLDPFTNLPHGDGYRLFNIPIEAGPENCGLQLLTELGQF